MRLSACLCLKGLTTALGRASPANLLMRMWKLLLMLLLLLLVMENGHQLLLLVASQWNRMRLGRQRTGRPRGHRGGIDRVNGGTARRLRNANVDADVDTADGDVGDGADAYRWGNNTGCRCCCCCTCSRRVVIAGADVGVAGMGRRLVLLERVLLAEALVADFAAVEFDTRVGALVFYEESLSYEGFFAVRTFVWFDARMAHLVSHPVGEISKRLLAVPTGELLLPVVDSHVVAQM